MASSLFRRWLRLYIPVYVTTFIYMTSWHAFGGIWVLAPESENNYRAELWHWYTDIKNFSFVFREGSRGFFNYGFHLWSIPVEVSDHRHLSVVHIRERSDKNPEY